MQQQISRCQLSFDVQRTAVPHLSHTFHTVYTQASQCFCVPSSVYICMVCIMVMRAPGTRAPCIICWLFDSAAPEPRTAAVRALWGHGLEKNGYPCVKGEFGSEERKASILKRSLIRNRHPDAANLCLCKKLDKLLSSCFHLSSAKFLNNASLPVSV